MKIIVTHASPDLDAITSIWLIRKFLPGWGKTEVRFVPAGERIGKLKVISKKLEVEDVIEQIGEDEVIHVDTGLGPLDHHQTASDKVCAASLTWDFVRGQKTEDRGQISEDRRRRTEKEKDREEAVSRMVKVVVDIDHFKEVFWEDATADYHEFSLVSVLDGLKLAKPDQDEYYVDFISECLDAILHEFENRIWAEKEIAEKGIKFDTRFGKGMGFETINDSVLKLAQKMGYVVVVRKDPRKGYVRIKAMPDEVSPRPFNASSKPSGNTRKTKKGISDSNAVRNSNYGNKGTAKSAFRGEARPIDLTLAYEKLKKMDPEATWFLHIGKKMLLNGSVKNPKMRPTRLGLSDIIKVLERI